VPWSIEDVEGFKKGLSDAGKRQWIAVANSVLARCTEDGGRDEATCAALAIKQANGVVEATAHEQTPLREKLMEALFAEDATFKATVQGFLRAAHAVTKHPNIPDSLRKKVEGLRAELASKSWGDFDTADASEGTSGASESMREAVTKTEGGKDFPASDYAYVPDAESPSTWKLRLTATPRGDPDPGIVGAAAAALGPGGFRGQKVDIPAGDVAAVKARVRAAWKKANPDRNADEMPASIKESFAETLGAVVGSETVFREEGALVEIGV